MQYQGKLEKNNAMDFDDLIMLTVILLRTTRGPREVPKPLRLH